MFVFFWGVFDILFIALPVLIGLNYFQEMIGGLNMHQQFFVTMMSRKKLPPKLRTNCRRSSKQAY